MGPPARPSPLLPELQRNVELHGGHVLEVTGASGSGKSHLLLAAAAKCLLPKEKFGGWEASVVWFDLDGHFEITRLLQLLQAQIQYNAGVQEDGGQVVKACMERFYYTRCYDSFEFLIALKCCGNHMLRARDYGKPAQLLVVDRLVPETHGFTINRSTLRRLRSTTTGFSADRIPGLCSITAFYHIDRAAPSTAPSLGVQGILEAVVLELKHLRSLSHPTGGLLVMVSKLNIFSTDSNQWRIGAGSSSNEALVRNDGREYGRWGREFLPAVWQVFVTHRLMLESQVVDEEGTVFRAEWVRPPVLGFDEFTIHVAGIKVRK